MKENTVYRACQCIDVPFCCTYMPPAIHTCFVLFSLPQDDKAQENLRLAAEHLRSVVNAAANSPLKKKVIKKLQVAAKQVAAVSTQLIAASQGTAASNRSPHFMCITTCSCTDMHIT